MSRLSWAPRVGALLFTVAVVGCKASVQTTVTADGAADLNCPRELTTPWISDTERFLVRGCGRERPYECKLAASADVVCTPLGEVSVRAARAGKPVKLSAASELDLALDAVESQVLACRPSAHRLDVPFRVIAGTSSDGILADGDKELAPAEATCVKTTFVRASVPDRIPKIEGDKHWGKLFTFSRDRGRTLELAAPPPAPAALETPPATSPPSGDDAVEARVRARITENAAAIVACAGKSPVAVEASYDAAGKLTLALRGDQHGTPAERCITTALPSLGVEGGGSAGTLIHLVR